MISQSQIAAFHHELTPIDFCILTPHFNTSKTQLKRLKINASSVCMFTHLCVSVSIIQMLTHTHTLRRENRYWMQVKMDTNEAVPTWNNSRGEFPSFEKPCFASTRSITFLQNETQKIMQGGRLTKFLASGSSYRKNFMKIGAY